MTRPDHTPQGDDVAAPISPALRAVFARQAREADGPNARVLFALQAVGLTQQEATETAMRAGQQQRNGMVWLGDLAGMEVVPVLREGPQRPNLQLRLTHRCGHEGVLMVGMGMDGISEDGAVMLGNLVEFAAQLRDGHACPPHNPSPEHRARVARWTENH